MPSSVSRVLKTKSEKHVEQVSRMDRTAASTAKDAALPLETSRSFRKIANGLLFIKRMTKPAGRTVDIEAPLQGDSHRNSENNGAPEHS